MRGVVWFRTDLRVSDNTALAAALSRCEGVVGLFVVSLDEWRRHGFAPVKVDLWLRSARELARELAAVGIGLEVRVAEAMRDVPRVVGRVAEEGKCGAVFANAEYEIDEARRDERAGEVLREAGVGFELFHDQVFAAPGEVRTGEGRYFTVFTPFKAALFKRMRERGVPSVGGAVPKVRGGGVFVGAEARSAAGVSALVREAICGEAAPDWDVVLKRLGIASEGAVDRKRWPAGERAARERLAAFVRGAIVRYGEERDVPSRAGTSGLSAAMNLGLVSCRECLGAALEMNGVVMAGRARGGKRVEDGLDAGNEGITTWISELVWREFYIHVMAGYPRVCMHRAFKPETERVRWKENPAHLEAWKAGRTGVPIVDAGMRQLAATGWMHNRVRMITAMYLSKNLLLDWRLGEAWFMANLVDGFLASNNGGWQWSASTGTDAAPYFRVFNPVSQSRRFDPEGAYIKDWVPELRGLDAESVHEPWEMAGLARARVEYPEPLVDLGRSRAEAIAAFKGLK
jgi:deoxyribodipyrimidine photo-lyase